MPFLEPPAETKVERLPIADARHPLAEFPALAILLRRPHMRMPRDENVRSQRIMPRPHRLQNRFHLLHRGAEFVQSRLQFAQHGFI